MTTLAITFTILGLTITAFILKNAILMLAGALGWVLFAFLMYGKSFANPFMNTGLLMFGGALAIVCAVQSLNTWTSGRRGPPEEDEMEEYRKRVLRITQRR